MQEQVHTVRRFKLFLLEKYLLRFIAVIVLIASPLVVKWLLFETDFVVFFMTIFFAIFIISYVVDICAVKHPVVSEVAVLYTNEKKSEVS